jgi:N-acetylmuramoyl-L-alanine amidase
MRVSYGRRLAPVAVCLVILGMAAARGDDAPKVGARLERKGDEIVVCGQLFHTTAPVVLWTDPGGYDAYRVERRFVPLDEAGWEATQKVGQITSPARFGLRRRVLNAEQVERVRGGGWDLDTLRTVVDQFVIHFDVCGTSKRCFQILHDYRGLSVHFLLDVDGTIDQTLDLKERAWHATIANDRSVGIEIANMGAYSTRRPGTAKADPLSAWYAKDASGKTILTFPGGLEKSGIRDRSQPFHPARDEPIVGTIQGEALRQYDLTPQQYDSLTKLTATLCTVLPKIRCDYPRGTDGKVIPHKLPDAQLSAFQGVLGHYHVQTDKNDPGPAFQWDIVIDGARKLMGK